MFREFLLQYMNESVAMGVQFLVALIAVLLLFGVFVWFLRLITGTRPARRIKSDEPRLAVLDRTPVDENRSLLLVSRDGVEHLLMVGGPSDVVVESRISGEMDSDSEEFEERPGHEIARRVIAQRPLRTISLVDSEANVAESLGLIETREETATPLAAPVENTEAEKSENLETQLDEETLITPEPRSRSAEISVVPASVEADPLAPTQFETPRDEVSQTAGTIVENPTHAAEPTPSFEHSPAPAREPIEADVTMARPTIHPEERAAPQQKRGPRTRPRSEPRADVPQETQEVDLAGGLAAALAADSPAPATNDQFDQQPTRRSLRGLDLDEAPTGIEEMPARSPAELDEAAFENAIADLVAAGDSPPNRRSNVKSTMSPRRESAMEPRSERSGSDDPALAKLAAQDRTLPGHADDEMDRLLGELATPGRN